MALFSRLAIEPKSLVSWRSLAIIFALLNLKSLPFSWHIRFFYHFFRNLNLRRFTTRNPPPLPAGLHPIFAPSVISSFTPLLETDYNLHKSNSTYFADLDVSRTALVTNLYSPGLGVLNRQMKEPANGGYKGRMNVVLGSVYCSFRREIKPYEGYQVESRVLGWDEKWMYIGSWFVRKGKGTREVLASALSKYVVKKGRFTVGPAKVLEASGYLSTKAQEKRDMEGELDEAEGNDGVTATTVPEAASTVLVEITDRSEPKELQGSWDHEAIERQRLKGMDVVKAFVGLDLDVLEEFEREVLP